jgi:hypothetical protein
MSRRIVQDAETGKPESRRHGYVYQMGRKKGDLWNPLKNVRTADIELMSQGNTDRKKFE